MHHDVEAIARACDPNAKRRGNEWLIRCPNPAHDDTHASCYLTQGDNGLLWHCQSCKDQEGVRIGIEATGLYKFKPSADSMTNYKRGREKDDFLARFKAARAEQDAESLILSVSEFKALDWPGVFPVLGPFNRGSVSLIGGSSGLGKSWLAMIMCNAIAGGHSLGMWPASPGCKALLVDGELTGRDLVNRQATIARQGEYAIISSAHFQRLGRGRLNLMEQQTQDWLVEQAKPYDFVALDNLFGLFPTSEGKPSVSVEYWQVVDSLTIRMKQQGNCVVIFDHLAEYGGHPYPGKGGEYIATKLQGSASKRWAADLVGIMLRHEEWEPGAPPQFLLSFAYGAGGKVRGEWNSTYHRDREWQLMSGWFIENPFKG